MPNHHPPKNLLFLLFLTLALTPGWIQAQRAAGDVGIGLQLGQPSGLSLAVYQPTGLGLDVLAAWDLNDFFYLNPHGVFNNHLGSSEVLHVFYGPGAYLGLYERDGNTFDIRVGISGTAGLSLMLGKLEVYGRVTPRLQLVKSTNARIGGGLGLRLYL